MKKVILLFLLSLVFGRASAQSYCSPSWGWSYGACAYYGMTFYSVSVTGDASGTYPSFSDGTSCDGSGYYDFSSTYTVSMMQAQTYNMNITTGGYNPVDVEVWIDFNDDGTFDESEDVGGVDNLTSSSGTISLSIPATATTGTHRMRAEMIYADCCYGYSWPGLNPCGDYYGEARDYSADIEALPSCTGTPTGGSATASLAYACSTSSIVLGASGETVASGMTYQWQSSSDGSSFSDISGATTLPYTFSGMTANTWFQVVITCTSSGTSATSSSVEVYTSPCYCTPSYYYSPGGNEYMNYFDVSGESGTYIADDLSAMSGTSGYMDRTGVVSAVEFQQGGSYSGYVDYNTSYYGTDNQIWIDFNDDGTFAASEAVTGVFGAATSSFYGYYSSASFTMNIPLTATTGTHRMRVRNCWYYFAYSPDYSSSALDPCNNQDATNHYWSGGTADYLADIIAAPSCSGTPTAGTASANVTTACTALTVVLSVSGETIASGMDIQWQSSPDGTTWSDIPGATTIPYSFAGLSSNTFYQCVITCTSSGGTATTNTVEVDYAPCYCTPTDWDGAYYYYAMDHFYIPGESSTSINDDLSSYDFSDAYIDRTTSVSAVKLQQGSSYSGSIGYYGYGSYDENQIWIDFGDDGTFDASDAITGVISGGYSSSTFTANIPITADTGKHRMRVRNACTFGSTSSAMNPCSYYDASAYYYYGLTADYWADIVMAPACSGTPSPGTASVNSCYACSTASITLNDVGISASGGLGGITVQWQSSPDSSSWTDISGATSIPYTYSGLTATTYFRCVVTCASSGLSAATAGIKVGYTPCYCTPSYYSAYYYEEMSYFSLNGYSSTSISDDLSSFDMTGTYADRTCVSPIQLQQGGSYSGTITDYGYEYYYMNEIWIDFNDDGTFASSESVTGVFGTPSSYTGSSTFTLNVPIAASTGTHRMRVRQAYTSSFSTLSTEMDPCNDGDYSTGGFIYYWEGMTADYMATIVGLPACSGTPTAGTASSNKCDACSSTSITLNVTGFTAAGSLSFQWQSSPDSTTWTDISGATTVPYTFSGLTTTTYFRCVITCTVSGSSASTNGVKIIATPCYCTPSYYDGWYYYYSPYYFYMPGESSTSINDNLYSLSTTYADRSCAVAPITLQQGNSYSGSVSYYYSYYYRENSIWIDFNDDGTFSSAECISGVFGSPSSYVGSATFTATIPITATTGTHRMRFRNSTTYSFTLSTSMDPCNSYDASDSYYYGVTADYLANITAAPACTGTPSAGTASASACDACSSTSITLNASGTSASSGLTYQWQSSPDSSTWTDISGATTYPYTFSGMTATTYYRLVVTCTADGASGYSNGVKILSAPCYCTPSYYYSPSGNEYMDYFSLTGESSTSISDNLSGMSGTSGYMDRTCAVAPITLQQGNTYSGSVTYSGYYDGTDNQIWIDFNDDGTFAASEAVTGVFGAATSAFFTSYSGSSFSLTIPITATTGEHRMRVRNCWYYFAYSPDYSSSALSPCNNLDATNHYWSGGTADYLANITSAPSCTGTPSAGTASANKCDACSSTSITLSSSGYTIAGGETFQWQSSPDSSTWTDISGATTVPYTFSGLSASAYYRLVVTCTSSGSSANSNGVKILYAPCYCTPSYYDGWYYYYSVYTFYMPGESSGSINDNLYSLGVTYADRTCAVAPITLQQGNSYTGSVSYYYSYYYRENDIWIDFNDDGTFATSESVTGVFGSPSSYTGSDAFTATIPITATTGTHRMRFRNATTYSYTLSSAMSPCNSYDGSDSYYYGTAADYLVNITSAPSCTGTPTAGTASANKCDACSSTSITLSATGYTVAGGETFQWQSSPDSATWSDISGATTVPYTFSGMSATTYYRLTVTCTSSGGSASTAGIKIIGAPCYCTPSYYDSWYYYYAVYTFSMNGESGTSISSDNLYSLATTYADRTCAVAPITLQQGNSYTGSVVYYYYNYDRENDIWIDFNDNGTFATSESVTGVFGNPGSYEGGDGFTATIPITAPTGEHRMRFRNATTFSSTLSSSMDPCNYYDSYNYYYYGVAADYLVNITAAPSCTGAPTAGTASTDKCEACSSSSITLGATGYTIAGGETFQWQSSPDSATWTDISGATSVPYSYSGMTSTTYFRLVVTCTSAGLSDYSNGVKVIYAPCYCTPTVAFGIEYYYAMSYFSVTGDGTSAINDDLSSYDFSTNYVDRTCAVAPLQVTQGATYTGYVDYYGAAFGSDENQIWIDFGDDGTFNSSDAVSSVFGYGDYYSSSFSMTIPLTGSGGTHRMRVRNVYGYAESSAMDPCNYYDSYNYYYYGIAADYLVNVTTVSACSTAPTAGTASTSACEACSSSTITLNATGYTLASGLTFQWQSSSDSTTWTDISGATTVPYSYSGLSSTTYFRLVVTCTSLGLSDNTNGVKVVYAPCYCTPNVAFGTDGYYAMSSFYLPGDGGTSISDDISSYVYSTNYVDRTCAVAPPSLEQGNSYSGSIGYYGYAYGDDENQIWIDFGDDGTFGASDAVTPVFGWGDGYSSTYTLTIPISATTGEHRMRVRNVYTCCSESGSMDPCNYYDSYDYYYYGIAADYLVNVTAAPACSGAPTAGTASAASGCFACSSSTVTVVDAGFSVASGETFQWQSSSDSATWSDISGATGSSYTFSGLTASTYFRCVVTCTSSGLSDNTNGVLVTYGACYCTPSYYYGTYSYDAMSYFSITGYAGTSISDDLSSYDGSNYVDRTCAVAAVELQQGGSYTGYCNIGYYYSENFEIWIDFNNDGTFSSSEDVSGVFGYTGSYTTSYSFTVNIPSDATGGYHRMRVRQAETYSGSLSTEMDPCNYYDSYNYYYYGLTADYEANIQTLSTCSGTPDPGATTATTSEGCGAISTTLSISSVAAGETYQWDSSSDGSTFYAISGATSVSYSTTVSNNTWYRCEVTCTSSGLEANSTPIEIIEDGPSISLASTGTVCAGSTLYLSATTGGDSYYWTGPDGFYDYGDASTSISSATTDNAGTYVFYAYSDATGCTSSASVFAVVDPVTSASVTASPSSICPGGTSVLTDVVSPVNGTLGVYAMPTSWTDISGSTNVILSGTDDGYTTVSIPFSFTFYGTSYSSVNVNSNGFLSFTSTSSPYSISSSLPSSSDPEAMIAPFWHDMKVGTSGSPTGAGGNVTWSVIGSSPNREFIVSYNNVGDYSGSETSTGEVILYETTNVIDINVKHASLDYNKISGIQDATGSYALTPSGENDANYTADNESWRYAPSSLSYAWTPTTDLSDPSAMSPTSTGLESSTTYSVSVTDAVSGCAGTASVEVNVNPSTHDTLTGSSVACTGDLATITFSGGAYDTMTYYINYVGPYTVVLDAAGTYNLTTYPPAGTNYFILTGVGSYSGCTGLASNDTFVLNVSDPGTWTGVTSTDWSDGSNWSCGTVPNSTITATIPAGTPYSPEVSGAGGGNACADLVIQTGATVTVDIESELWVYGNLNNNGSVVGNGYVRLEGSSAQSITGHGWVSNMSLDNSAGASMSTSSDSLFLTGEVDVNTGTLSAMGNFVLTSSSAGTAIVGPVTGSLSGQFTCQQWIQGGYRAFRFFGHPFTGNLDMSALEDNIDVTGEGGSAHGFTSTYTNNPSSFFYTPADGDGSTLSDPGWHPFVNVTSDGTDSTTWYPYEGVRVMVRGAKGTGLWGEAYTPAAVTIDFTGELNYGTLAETMHTGSGSDYNLLGNPYACPVDIGTALYNAANIDGTVTGVAFWVWKATEAPVTSDSTTVSGAYETIPMDGTPYYLESYGAFEAEAAYDGALLSFNETMKGNPGTEELFKSTAVNHFVTLHLYDAAYHSFDRTYINFKDGTSPAYSKTEDARKLNNMNLDFYSVGSDGSKLSIDARPYEVGQVIPLGLLTNTAQGYIIKVDNYNVPMGAQLYLHDKYLGTYTALSAGTTYSFNVTSDTATKNSRFELSLQGDLSVTNVRADMKVEMNPNPTTDKVVVSYSAPSRSKTQIRVMNAVGQQVYVTDLGTQQSGSVEIDMHELPSGVYMVEFSNGEKTVTQRLVKN